MELLFLKKLTVRDYKCFTDEKAFDFGKVTKISGKNKTGKSTVANAIMETLTGKNMDGSQAVNLRPNSYSDDEQNIEISREVIADINGIEHSIKRITKRKKERQDGQMVEVSGSNVTSIYIDGIKTNNRQYEEFIENNLCKFDTMLACINPRIFLDILDKSQVKAREFLEKMSGFDIKQFLSDHADEYSEIEKITKGHSVEEAVSSLKKQLQDQNNQKEKQRTILKYERERKLDEAEVDASILMAEKQTWENKLNDINCKEAEIDSLTAEYDKKNQLIVKLERKNSEIQNAANAERLKEKEAIQRQLFELREKKSDMESNLRNESMRLENTISAKKQAEDNIKKARADFDYWSKHEPEDSIIKSIEAENFDENEDICFHCKQLLPENMRTENREKWRKDHEQRLKKSVDDFELAKETYRRQREEIVARGNKAVDDLKACSSDIDVIGKNINELKQQIQDVAIEIQNKQEALYMFPDYIDMSDNDEYLKNAEDIKRLKEEISAMDNGADKRREIRNEQNNCVSQIARINSQIQKIESDKVEKERRISEIENDIDVINQRSSELYKQINLLTEFSIKKNDSLAQKINPLFNEFQFDFLEFTQTGEPHEVCKLKKGSTEYKDLSRSERIRVDADLLCGFQKMNGVELPILIDDTESVDSSNMPEFDRQTIIMKVISPIYMDEEGRVNEVTNGLFNPEVHKIIDDGKLRIENI